MDLIARVSSENYAMGRLSPKVGIDNRYWVIDRGKLGN